MGVHPQRECVSPTSADRVSLPSWFLLDVASSQFDDVTPICANYSFIWRLYPMGNSTMPETLTGELQPAAIWGCHSEFLSAGCVELLI